MGIFTKRVNYKPFEYPEVMEFVDRMNQTFWVHNEVDFTSDTQDFGVRLTESEKEVVKRSLLSIAQVEVAVKTFWGDLYKNLPKPEFNCLGATLAECEVRHSEAYSRLLDVLGYEKDFEVLLDNPVFKKKLALIDEIYDGARFIDKLLFFVIVIENTSLFSQFANILAFSRFSHCMKNVANIIGWTSIDEQTHADAGVFILGRIAEEYPEIRPSQEYLSEVVRKYITYEEALLDWIYEEGELKWFTKDDILNFMKKRVDDAIIQLGYEPIFHISNEQYKPMKWFDEEVFGNEMDDFFAKRPTAYTKHDKSISADDLF